MLLTSPYRQGIAALALLMLALTGCARFRRAVPAYSINAPRVFDAPRSNQQPINFLRLRQDPPPVYLLGPGDVLGIYIERVLGEPDVPPPVHFPEDTDIPPAIGYPTPVREDGTISLPLVPAIHVEGLTLAQTERLIREAYTVDQQILPEGQDRILVTLIKPRTYQVLVIREDIRGPIVSREGKGELVLGSGKRGETYVAELPAYENDVLHALSQSGGLPGVDAKNEITILRGAFEDADNLNPYVTSYLENRSGSPSKPNTLGEVLSPNPSVTKIPLRTGPYDPPVKLTQNDIILDTGDIVFIESREAEVFYAGGLLKGGQFPIPRDYDLDVLGAIAMAGGSVAAAAGGSGTQGALGSGGARGVGSIFPPTRVTVIRTINGQQTPIRLSLKRAIRDPAERILIQPNDIILLEYTPIELVLNILLNNLQFNYFLNNIN